MGWSFRKTKKVGPVNVTVSKTGVGVSVGAKGERVDLGADGRVHETIGIPGTGISYRTSQGVGAPRRGRRWFMGGALGVIIAALTAGRAQCQSMFGSKSAPEVAPAAAPATVPVPATSPATEPTRTCHCRDGSPGCCGRGCCSGHGGIAD
jgi:hypothetical protein